MDENINMKKRINQILKRDVIIEQIKKNINEFNSKCK